MTRVNTTFSNAFFLTNTDQGDQWTASVKGERRMRNGLFASASYLYGRSNTVNDGASSTAFSNWQFLYTRGNSNLPVLGISDRDIRHRFNMFAYFELPGRLDLNTRIQARTAQPITASPRVLNGEDRGRNSLRKDNEYFSFDWRLGRPFNVGKSAQIIPTIEMFNTFNNDNNINPLSTPALFDFAGFLRTGVGDPRQVQLAVKFVF